MTELKPPPYKPRLAEGEVDKEEKLTEEQLHGRDVLLRNIVITAGVGMFAGIVLLLRELPGGGRPYLFALGMVPSVAYWLLVLVVTMVLLGRADRKRRILQLVLLLAVVSAASGICAFVQYQADPAAWTQEFERRFP